MIGIAWPLVLVVILDVLGIGAIVSGYLEGTITGRLEGAYIAFGLCVFQIPLCLYGRSASDNAGQKVLMRV